MQISELARRAGVTVKAVRYYESLGLITPERLPNGYRIYGENHLLAVTEIRELAKVGIAAKNTAPFLECLELGHQHSDDCVSSLATYRDSLTALDRAIATLQQKRTQLADRLNASASRSFKKVHQMNDYTSLPDNLPVPQDNGEAKHLQGMAMPPLELTASDGTPVALNSLGAGRSIIYLYPLTGQPGIDLPEGWDSIPGARGCSTEACNFRDHFTLLQAEGVTHVFGLSSQDISYQAEVVDRLRLPFTMLSDGDFQLAEALQLPTFQAPGHDRLYTRLTLVVRENRVEHTFYPIFPPNTHAQQVLTWLRENPYSSSSLSSDPSLSPESSNSSMSTPSISSSKSE